jgi:hypothetical protein
MERHSIRTILPHGGRLGTALLAPAILALVFTPTDPWWWLVRLPGMLALLLAGLAFIIHPASVGPPWHRLFGWFALVATGLHVLSVSVFEPPFWRWLDWSLPIDILCGLVAALALLAAFAVRRSLKSPKALLLHRMAGFTVAIAASAHFALIAGTGAVSLGLVAAGTLLLVTAVLMPEKRKPVLMALPAVLLGLVAALAVGPLAQARLAALRSAPIDHARFSHDDHTGFVCTTCHHNFTDRADKENCISCHKRLSTSEAMRVDRLFHAFCSDCHRREKLLGRETGPIDHCTACHDS